MTSVDAMYQLHQSIKYIITNEIPGDFVECGVWRGGSVMNIALTLSALNVRDRKIWLYDTFSGMSQPEHRDIGVFGEDAVRDHARAQVQTHNQWCYASLEDVQANVARTEYPPEQIMFIKGKVEDTIPKSGVPSSIALLRLDTDWYQSTFHELHQLYPLISKHGVLIIDDYGHWQGARDAVDDFLKTLPVRPLLHRINYSVRSTVKPS